MSSRELGRRRVKAVTMGLAAASLAGTVAVGAAAYAASSDEGTDPDGPTVVPTGSTGPGATVTPGATAAPGPGATAKPAPPNATAPSQDFTPPIGAVTEQDQRPPHAKSGGS